MRWTDVSHDPRMRTLREFATCLLIVSCVLPLASNGNAAVVAAVATAALGLFGLVRPRTLRPLYVGWSMAVFPLAWLVSNIVLLLIYFTILTPMSLGFRLIGRDALGRQFDTNRVSYWEDSPQPQGLDRYFRQY